MPRVALAIDEDIHASKQKGDDEEEDSEPTRTDDRRRLRPPETSRQRQLVVALLLTLCITSGLVVCACCYYFHRLGHQANNLLRGVRDNEQTVTAATATSLHASFRQLQEEENSDLLDADGGKGPFKGDRDCQSFGYVNSLPGIPPCHDDIDGDDTLLDSAPEAIDPNATEVAPGDPEGFRPVGPSRPQPPSNVVDLTVFVALDPGARSIAHSVAKLITETMNTTLENMEFFMDHRDTEQDNMENTDVVDIGSSPQNNDGGEDEHEQPPEGSGIAPVETEPLPEGTTNRTRPEGSDPMPSQPDSFSTNTTAPALDPEQDDLSLLIPDETGPLEFVGVQPRKEGMDEESEASVGTRNTPPRSIPPQMDRFHMYYLNTRSQLGRQRSDRWWWKYDIQYLCRWEDSEAPVLSDEKMSEIAANMTKSLDEQRLSELLRNMTDSRVVVLKVYPETDSGEPPDSSNENLLLDPLDARQWSWTRYLGFAVFLGTVSGLFLTSLIGSFRRQRKIRQQVWGNLASEEGVRELLNTGWVLHDNRMEVFHKDRAGYRDDDSVLIGGYEQREPGPGTEIFAPTLTTQEGSSTRGPSTTPDNSINTQRQSGDAESAQFHIQEGPTTSSSQQRRALSNHTGPSMQAFSAQVFFVMILQALVPVSGFVNFGARTRSSASCLYKSAKSMSFDDQIYDPQGNMIQKTLHHESFARARQPSFESIPSSRGLSRFHQSILSRTRTSRQALVTGRDPVTLSLRDSPTLKWLANSAAPSYQGSRPSTSQLYVNGTVLEKSTASLDRFLWLQDETTIDDGWYDELPYVPEVSHDYFTVEWVAEILMERPGYVNVLPRECLMSSLDETKNRHEWSWHIRSRSDWQQEAAHRLPPSTGDVLVCTGFSLARRNGLLATVDAEKGRIIRANDRTRSQLLWPNEVTPVPEDVVAPRSIGHSTSPTEYQDAVLVSDGFLVPGKDRGGLYLVRYAGNPQKEWTIRLTTPSSTWFYHKATWIDLTGDGRKSVLTARCRVTTKLGGRPHPEDSKNDVANQVMSGIAKEGELVWIEAPKPHSYDPQTGTPLEADGTVFDPFASRHLPWKEHVLATGPDVMFAVADLDPSDDCVEVIASLFFDQSVRLYSIKRGAKPYVTFKRDIDMHCGPAFACLLSDLDQDRVDLATEDADRFVIDAGSTVQSLRHGDRFSHLLVTSHECTYEQDDEEVPTSSAHRGLATDRSKLDGGSVFAYRVPTGKSDAWKTEPWLRTTVATGFTVRGQLGNVINPGAPGFCYTFPARKGETGCRPLLAVAGDCAESAFIFRPIDSEDANDLDPSTRYKLMVEIECESTVGSIGVGYGDFMNTDQDENEGYAKLYIPCFEKDKVLVFSLGRRKDGLEGL